MTRATPFRARKRPKEREKQIIRDLRRTLQAQRDMKELLIGICASIDSALRKNSNKKSEKVERDIEQGRKSLENDQYETGIMKSPKTHPTKSQWWDLTSLSNAGAI